ncbi:N-acetylmuramoyl-L-alanine amidase [candidate division KSB1 bacterium]|nr:N-acetylmuramoyl-L-alanine amidase [candidate division KSB1 bacterium]
MQELGPVLTALTVAAGLALAVERTLEFLKHIIDQGVGSIIPNKQLRLLQNFNRAIETAEKALELSEKSVAAEKTDTSAPVPGVSPNTAAELSARAGVIEKHPPPRMPIIPLTPLSKGDTASMLFLQVAGAGLGIVFAQLFDLRLLSIFLNLTEATACFTVFDILFTGIVIGGGSQPIHVLIRFLTERKITVTAEEGEQVKKSKSIARTISSAELVEEKKEDVHLWKDIPYTGGVNPAGLDTQHKRPGDPNLAVFHHTAMSSAASFQDIVDEFLIKKKWLTGYHCVIMPDGTIQPFCRWDRYGNHTKGRNARSLGIAFHGNFHTEPDDKFSNADGRYGNQKPTEAQLHAGARVVALWIYLYDAIHLDFDNCILPHRKALPGHTVCPGSNFAYNEFEKLVRHYHDAWRESDLIQDEIEKFKQKKYIYA